MRHEILCNFCYLFNNPILHKPFKNKDLYDTMVDTLKHLQVHAIPYKYCYRNASKCDYIVIFLTIYFKMGRGYFLLAIKTLPLLPGGVLINSGIFTCPVRYMAVYTVEIIFQTGSRTKKERPFLIPLHSYLMNRTLMIQLFHLLL